jgi:hypothetical protein
LFDSRLEYKLYVHAPNRSFVHVPPLTTRDSPNGARSVLAFWGGGALKEGAICSHCLP